MPPLPSESVTANGARAPRDVPYRALALCAMSLCLLVGLVYWPGLEAPMYLDDLPNIKNNATLRISSLEMAVLRALESGPSGDRPVSMLSFALHYYVGAFAPRDFRLVNLVIHALNAVMLLLVTCHLLLIWGRTRGIAARRAVLIAGAAAAVWALHPMQLTAVTYIVQRMTSLATLFFTAAFSFYLAMRSPPAPKLSAPLAKALLGIGALICFWLGMKSKPHVVVLPVVIMAAEVMLFGTHRRLTKRQYKLLGAGLAAVLLLIVVTHASDVLRVVELVTVDLLEPVGERRGGTPLRRLITAPRIWLLYLSLFFFPVWTRFSLFWRFDPSRGLFDPPETLFAWLLVGGLLYVVWRLRRRAPLIAWGILCFFVAHLLEGTIVPLFLVFEHRMYLPSVFLVLAGAGIAAELLEAASIPRARLGPAIAVVTAVVVGALAYGTMQRNALWSRPVDFMRHQVEHNPTNVQAKSSLAMVLFSDETTSPRVALEYAEGLSQQLQAREPTLEVRQALVELHGRVALYFLEEERDLDRGLAELLKAASYGYNGRVSSRLGAFYFHARHDGNIPVLMRLQQHGFAGDATMLRTLELPYEQGIKSWVLVTNLIAAYEFMARTTGDRSYAAKGLIVAKENMRRYGKDPIRLAQLRSMVERFEAK